MKPTEPNPKPKPIILVLSGPSGVGKDYILNTIKAQPIAANLAFIVTNTTRPIRKGEIRDAHYHFVTPDEFQRMIAAGELLEYAQVYGNWYGVSKESVRTELAAGKDVIIKFDIQGAQAIKHAIPQAVLVFLSPPSLSELAARLSRRNTESPTDLARRLKTAEDEMTTVPDFDYVVVNQTDQADRAITTLKAIITAEKHRVNRGELPL